MNDDRSEQASPWMRLRHFTQARVALGRAGCGLPTKEHLRFQWDHAIARDAVYSVLETNRICDELITAGFETRVLKSAATDRRMFLQRPDLGRRVAEASYDQLTRAPYPSDVAFVLADGLSATAINVHALPLLRALLPALLREKWLVAPVCVVEQGRVAIGDEIAGALGAAMVVVLIGERPGLSAPDSLGVYLTWNPRPGITDASRNCISNVRTEGLSYSAAAHKLHYLMREARRRSISGIDLKEAAHTIVLPGPGPSHELSER